MVVDCKDGFPIANGESLRDVLSCFDWEGVSTATQQSDFMEKLHQRISPEAEAGAWLRDEPIDIGTNGGFHPSSTSTALVGIDRGGSASSEGKMEVGGQSTDGSWSSGCASDLSKDAAGERLESSKTESLFAQLKATKIKESVMLDAIQRFGGGQKGLRGVIKAIMFWLEARNRFTSQSGDRCTSQSQSVSPVVKEVDELSWSNADAGGEVDVQFGSSGNFDHASPADLNCMRDPTPSRGDDGGSLCDLSIGGSSSGEYAELGYRENRYHDIGEPGTGGLPGGLASQGSCVSQNDISPLSSGNWVSPMRDYILRPENLSRARMSRKLSSSPEISDLHMHNTHDVVTCDDNHSHRSKIRRHSRTSGFSFSEISNELPVYGSGATPSVSEISGTAGIFGAVGANPCAPGGPFSLSSTSSQPMDQHSPDFNSFGIQGSILNTENLCLGAPAHSSGLIDRLGSFGYSVSPDDSVTRKNERTRLGELAKSKPSPAACTRLARKKRMDRNRKAASFQANRGALETGALLASKTGAMWSSGSLQTLSRSLASPASEGQACRTKDRKDQEHLQFLLQKVLRPSDVGNLGRIVLPKKDAESHLPWLAAREGIQFPCEDYDTGEKLTLRYRFWPNNKSRMYLLENTGDFVRKHKLQESDRMQIYRNKQQGSYIIRARKARDCVGSLLNRVQIDEVEGDGKEMGDQNSCGCSGSGSSEKFPYGRDVETPESNVCSGLEGAPEPVAAALDMEASRDDLMNFADLPDAPMGEGTEDLVRFPSLESFDVELLELGPAAADKQNSRSCAVVADKA